MAADRAPIIRISDQIPQRYHYTKVALLGMLPLVLDHHRPLIDPISDAVYLECMHPRTAIHGTFWKFALMTICSEEALEWWRFYVPDGL